MRPMFSGGPGEQVLTPVNAFGISLTPLASNMAPLCWVVAAIMGGIGVGAMSIRNESLHHARAVETTDAEHGTTKM